MHTFKVTIRNPNHIAEYHVPATTPERALFAAGYHWHLDGRVLMPRVITVDLLDTWEMDMMNAVANTSKAASRALYTAQSETVHEAFTEWLSSEPRRPIPTDVYDLMREAFAQGMNTERTISDFES